MQRASGAPRGGMREDGTQHNTQVCYGNNDTGSPCGVPTTTSAQVLAFNAAMPDRQGYPTCCLPAPAPRSTPPAGWPSSSNLIRTCCMPYARPSAADTKLLASSIPLSSRSCVISKGASCTACFGAGAAAAPAKTLGCCRMCCYGIIRCMKQGDR